ncbi:MAG: LCP family protein, partial [Eggerthellaceae bacterium]|nr:LCP family protein [Eggerthellaceae bacterium]
RVNFNTFIKFVDALGGVDITLTKREADGLNMNIVAYNQDLCDWVQEGDNHMNGFLALQYARMRKIDSDWVRVTRQRATIEAILAKAKTLSVGELDDVLDGTLPNIKTNLSEQEITLLFFKIPLFLEAMDIQGITVPVDGT